MRLFIRHTTSYHYTHPVPYALQQLRLTPKSRASQQVLDWRIRIEGGRTEVTYTDAHENVTNLISFDADVTDIVVRCEGEVEMTDTHGITGPHSGYVPLWLFRRATPRTRPGPHARRLVRDLDREQPDLDLLHALSSAVLETVRYDTVQTDPGLTAEEVLEAGHGVCMDHAHIFVTCARLMDFPARYVSGYLMMNDRVEQDATHAWAEAHVDGLGWVGFDVSNGISPDSRYVRVATGLDYAEAAPVSGTRFGPGEEEMRVAVEVQQQ